MKKMKHGGKVHKRMQVGGKVMDPRLAAAAAANPANAPTRGSRPDDGRGAKGAMSLFNTMVRPGAMGGARGVGSRDEGPMVRPGFPSGPRPKGYGPNDGGPRPMGPRTPGPKGPMVQPGFPSRPRGAPVAQPLPRIGYGPKDGPVTAGIPAGMTKADYIASQGQPLVDRQTPTKDMGRASLTFRKGGAVKSKAMRGGGLARKGVGMALAKGGLARRAGGCAKRGVGRGKIT